MNLLRSVVMAFSMFSRLPMPQIEWKESNMRDVLALLPLVGCAEAAVLFVWIRLAAWLSLGPALFAAGMTLLPVLFTGGVHLDGFCDTVDALSSHGDMEKKRRILKDPHTGAFAVIFLCAYLLCAFALYTEADRAEPLPLCLLPILSRAVTGFAGVCFPVYGEAGLLATFRGSASKTAAAVLLGWFLACGVCAILLNGVFGLALPASAALCGAYVYRMSRKQFGGMSGDLAGYLLQISELCMLAAVILIQKAGLIWFL